MLHGAVIATLVAEVKGAGAIGNREPCRVPGDWQGGCSTS